MHRHPEVPGLLEQYRKASGTAECRVSVREFRSFFRMDEAAGPAFPGFLQRIHHGPQTCRYRVSRMEKFRDNTLPCRSIRKYLVQARSDHRSSCSTAGNEKNR